MRSPGGCVSLFTRDLQGKNLKGGESWFEGRRDTYDQPQRRCRSKASYSAGRQAKTPRGGMPARGTTKQRSSAGTTSQRHLRQPTAIRTTRSQERSSQPCCRASLRSPCRARTTTSTPSSTPWSTHIHQPWNPKPYILTPHSSTLNPRP